jgi:hypothetical protein
LIGAKLQSQNEMIGTKLQSQKSRSRSQFWCWSLSSRVKTNFHFRELWSIDFPLDQLRCQLDGVPLDLARLISQRKMTWPNHIYGYFPLIRYSHIILCEKSEI